MTHCGIKIARLCGVERLSDRLIQAWLYALQWLHLFDACSCCTGNVGTNRRHHLQKEVFCILGKVGSQILEVAQHPGTKDNHQLEHSNHSSFLTSYVENHPSSASTELSYSWILSGLGIFDGAE